MATLYFWMATLYFWMPHCIFGSGHSKIQCGPPKTTVWPPKPPPGNPAWAIWSKLQYVRENNHCSFLINCVACLLGWLWWVGLACLGLACLGLVCVEVVQGPMHRHTDQCIMPRHKAQGAISTAQSQNKRLNAQGTSTMPSAQGHKHKAQGTMLKALWISTTS